MSSHILQSYQVTIRGWDTIMVIHSGRAFDTDNSAVVVGICRDPTPYPGSDSLDSSDDLMYDVQRGGTRQPNTVRLRISALLYHISHARSHHTQSLRSHQSRAVNWSTEHIHQQNRYGCGAVNGV